jgi:tetratricopeptide (TPR) repeat protein
VTTTSAKAEVYVHQGMALLHGFWYYEAMRSFRAATRLDSTCALAWWGIYQTPRGSRSLNRSAYRRFKNLIPEVSDREQRYLRATVRLDSLGRKAYIEEMQNLITNYPKDVEAKIFLIRFLMRGYYPGHPREGEPDPIALIKPLLESHPEHLGVHHYYIHMEERGQDPSGAYDSAEKIARLAPGNAHIVHMPGHIRYLTGDYAGARSSFVEAFAVDSTYMHDSGTPAYNNWNYVHNLSYLVANCAEDGRYKEGLRWARKLEQVALTTRRTIIYYQGRMARVRLHMRYGEWELAAAAAGELAANDTLSGNFGGLFAKGMMAYARGKQAIAVGAAGEAARQQQKLTDVTWMYVAGTPTSGDRYYRKRRVDYLEILAEELQAQIHSLNGEHNAADAKIVGAIASSERLPYEEPPEFARSLHESSGEIALRAGHWRPARDALEKALTKRPQSAHMLLALARAYEMGNETTAATRVYKRALDTWRFADPDLPLLRQARARLAALGK